ncbi:helix-turn-helix domain-containing protein [Fructobacillus tropaeoli]|uniref:helix-turn-helix domain-containing protein n=1 Tax=Fructobacillus tropaeoli TaxID=709323 RepID=UPI001455F178|nr:helix-turn-helix transcriptional regulator [Fructobacillus tropaeoli]NLS38239.1 helix-turn-helix domain-containing protein [Fructobacillus tropaeoli]
MKFSSILKQERQTRSMTQSQLAERLYVSNKTISNWETEKTVPDLDNLILLSKELNISLDKLLLEDPTMVDNLKLKMGLRESRVFLLFASCTNLLLFIMLVINRIPKYDFFSLPLLVTALLCNVVVVLALSIRIQETEKELHVHYSFKMKLATISIAVIVMALMILLVLITSYKKY